ncbi:phage-related holin [Natranaerovirga hydrolytica]|uniref:Phage-related holin n=1 Tax=Natranaerovirga hydrolytica TaxID=680378 RepID=A0A4R1MZ13_9FIRM|nr:phage holin family protein [Natranaerovirga hydrolytica]TCK98496.1 phage-related holin [Natranaerovirga hydrolytica]
MSNMITMGQLSVIPTMLDEVLSEMTIDLIQILILLMIIDYITRIMSMLINHNAETIRHSQKRAIKNEMAIIAKKLGYLILITLTLLFDCIVFRLSKEGLGIGIAYKSFLAIFSIGYFLGIEGLSIAENLESIGVPIPNFIKKAYTRLKNASNK